MVYHVPMFAVILNSLTDLFINFSNLIYECCIFHHKLTAHYMIIMNFLIIYHVIIPCISFWSFWSFWSFLRVLTCKISWIYIGCRTTSIIVSSRYSTMPTIFSLTWIKSSLWIKRVFFLVEYVKMIINVVLLSSRINYA